MDFPFYFFFIFLIIIFLESLNYLLSTQPQVVNKHYEECEERILRKHVIVRL